MKPITNETRKLIVAAKERGEKPEVIAVWFSVAVSSVLAFTTFLLCTKKQMM